jgi:hypothetical protein
METTRYLTVDEYAEKARAAVSTVRYWRQTGYGPTGFRVGRRVLYREDEIDAWLASLEKQGTTA